MPLNYEEEINVEDEGMLGKILSDARKIQGEITEKINSNQAAALKNQIDAHRKIDELRVDIQKITENQYQLKEDLLEAISKMLEKKPVQKPV